MDVIPRSTEPDVRGRAVVWRATYRLQLHAGFTFDDARDQVPHIAELGASHLYLSPSLESVTGSTHGYDGTDPTTVSVERGGEDGLRALATAAHDTGLGILLDIVPNHLAASDETPWWVDLDERARIFDWDPATGWYRRFFDIDGLAGVRQEDPEVFARTHTKVLELVRDGVVDGLRIDHPDGLTDPAGYLTRLADAARVPIWVEKILHPGEPLRPWPVAGTMGYEFADDATALFVDPAGEATVTAAYERVTGEVRPFAEVAADAMAEQAAGPFAREIDRLAALAPDLPRTELAATVAAFPIYRTYVEPRTETVTDADRAAVHHAVAAAGASEALARRLLLDDRDVTSDELVRRFQQTTAPVLAKGVEDTAFYRWTRLLARNEVGTDPARFSLSVDGFHAACATRGEATPMGLLAATTHDTKRSADTRARIAALSAVGDELTAQVERWEALAQVAVDQLHAAGHDPARDPTAGERWLVFQTLIGSWPITNDRLDDYLVKAMREAGTATNWINPDEAHEAAVLAWYRALLLLPGFEGDFLPFTEQVVEAAEWSSVGQVLLRATTPGVCDVYEGDESWFLSVVDPDNRRRLDWQRRRGILDRVLAGDPPTRATAKTHVLHHALALRARRPGPFAPGAPYRPIEAGRATVAFTRAATETERGAEGSDTADVLVVVPVRTDPGARLVIPPGRWRDALGSGGAAGAGERELPAEVSVAELCGPLGVGLWERG